MKKFLFAISLSLAFLLVFNACGIKSHEKEEPTSDDVIIVNPDDFSVPNTEKPTKADVNVDNTEESSESTTSKSGIISAKKGDLIYECPAFSIFYEYLVYTADINNNIRTHAVLRCVPKDSASSIKQANFGIDLDSHAYYGSFYLDEKESYFIIEFPTEKLDDINVVINCEELGIEDSFHLAVADRTIETSKIYEDDNMLVEKCYIEQDVFDDITMFMKITAKNQKLYISTSDVYFNETEYEQTYVGSSSDELDNGKNTLTVEAGEAKALNMPFISDAEDINRDTKVSGKLQFILSYSLQPEGEKTSHEISVDIDELLEKTSF